MNFDYGLTPEYLETCIIGMNDENDFGFRIQYPSTVSMFDDGTISMFDIPLNRKDTGLLFFNNIAIRISMLLGMLVDGIGVRNYRKYFSTLFNLLQGLKYYRKNTGKDIPIIIDGRVDNPIDYIFNKIFDNYDDVELRAYLMQFVKEHPDDFTTFFKSHSEDMIL